MRLITLIIVLFTSSVASAQLQINGVRDGTRSPTSSIQGTSASTTPLPPATPPIVVTGTASFITLDSMTVAGMVTPVGELTTAYFQYGLDVNNLFSTASQNLGSGTVLVPVSASLTGLLCNQPYIFRLVAHGANGGDGFGQFGSASTSACTPPLPTAPTVVTGASSGITQVAANVAGTGNPNGDSTTCQFKYGPDTMYGSLTPLTGIGTGSIAVAVTAGLSNLTCNTTTHYLLTCTNGGGTVDGSDGSFATDACSSPTQRLLTTADFTYLGFYTIAIAGANSNLNWCLGARRVGGDLRFLTYNTGVGALKEYSIAGKSFGDTVNTTTNSWSSIGGVSDFIGCWYDDAQSRLWTVSTVNYTSNPGQVKVYTRTLNANGTTSNLHGPVGLSGVTAHRVFGGVAAVPSAIQSAWGFNPYLVGWGGGTSLVSSAGGSSIGLFAATMPDPSGYANSTEVPLNSFNTVASHVSGALNNSSCAPSTCDRGMRDTTYQNYQDGNDPRSNPVNLTTTVTVTGGTTVTRTGSGTFPYNNPSTGALSPSWWIGNGYTVSINGTPCTVAGMTSTSSLTVSGCTLSNGTGKTLVGPDPRPLFALQGSNWTTVGGVQRWAWVDSYWSTCNWIYEVASTGFVCVLTGDGNVGVASNGKSWYANSDVNRDGKLNELQIYDPEQFHQVKLGTRNLWNVQPVDMLLVDLPDLGNVRGTQLTPRHGAGSAFYDTVDKKFYIQGCRIVTDISNCRLYVFDVDVN